MIVTGAVVVQATKTTAYSDNIMPKTQTQTQPAEEQATDKIPSPMPTQTKSKTQPALNIVHENQDGTNRIAVYRGTHDWDPERDLSMLDLFQVNAALEMLGKFLAGGISGTPTLIFTAPIDKLFYANGTGTMAYVSSDHPAGKAIKFQHNGKEIALTVDAKYIPDKGWARLKLFRGQLYTTKLQKFYFTDDDPWVFWYCETGSMLLGNDVNISISLGPKTIDRGMQIIDLLSADDKLAANETRRQSNREQARVMRGQKQAIDSAPEDVDTSAMPDVAFLVPLYTGGDYSLKKHPVSEKIRTRNRSGFRGRPLELLADTDIAREAMARYILTENLTVEL